MSKNDKINFILRKKHLSLRELSAQTGLTETEIAEILKKGIPNRVSPATLPSFLQGGRGSLWTGALLLAMAVVLFYLPVLKNDFVNWDDLDNISGNLQIRYLDWASLRWMFTTFHSGNWIPLTWLSFALNYRFGGLDPRVFHVTNVFLHSLNSVLVFLVCFRLLRRLPENASPGSAARLKAFGLPISLMTALLFGLHPIHVESVAWATERKDVLYAFFFLGAIYVYLGEPPAFERKGFKPWACLGLYLLALMAKPMAVTLPLIFLVLDYWPLGRWGLGYAKLIREKAAFFALALGAALITVLSHEKTLSYAKSGVEFYWVMNAFRSVLFYLLKMAWPAGLTAYYPFPPEITGFYQFENFCMAAVVIVGSVLLFRYRSKVPYLVTAWLYYLVILLPVIGIVQTGSQAAADRYTYLASLGFFLPLSAGAAYLLSYRWVPYTGLVILITALLGWETMDQIGTWRDSKALWGRVTEVYPDENATSYSKLGAAYIKAHRYDQALEAYTRAASIPPLMATTINDLGIGLLYKERVPEAVQEFEYALTLDPQFTQPRQNLWTVYEHLGRHEEAIGQMQAALKIEPESALFNNNLGVSYGFLKRYGQAQTAFEKANRLEPGNSEYLVNLATIYLWEGQPERALEWYREGIAQHPGEPVYYLKMADIYLSQGLNAKALEKLRVGWELNPTSPKVIQQMGEDFEKTGQGDLAQQCFAKAKAVTAGQP